MGKEIHLPIPKLPDRLPFEPLLERISFAVARKVTSFPLVKAIDSVGQKIPYPAEGRIGTPFGSVRLPPLNIPTMKVPKMDERQIEAFKASVGKDLVELLAKIPYASTIPGVGEAIEAVADTYAAKIHESMTPEQYEVFKKWEKKSPASCVAVIQSFIREKK